MTDFSFSDVSFIDRIVMYLMVEPIKRDMNLSDIQVGLLLGPSFAILSRSTICMSCYSLLGHIRPAQT